MHTIQDDTIRVDQETKKLQAFRLEDTTRAPVIILYIDDNQAEMIPLKPGQIPPTTVKSANMESEVQIITYDEVHSFMHQEHKH
nr:hypothetical protein [uncultured Desulfobulbus sp.]